MKINEKIYRLRKKLGWSQDELAEKLSVSTDYLLDDSKEEYIFPQTEESIDTADKIVSKGESLFRNYGWILGVVLLLLGLQRFISVVSVIATIFKGGAVGMLGMPAILPAIFSALTGLAFVVGGIIMIKHLRKNKK